MKILMIWLALLPRFAGTITQPIQDNIVTIQEYTDLKTPEDDCFKSYMSYKAITDKDSAQFKLQSNAVTNELGVRTYNGRLCVAVGTYYSEKIGTKIDVYMENGEILECVVADIKADIHTDSKNQQHLTDKSVIEFIVDTRKIPELAKKMGNMEYADDKYKGKIDYIRVFDGQRYLKKWDKQYNEARLCCRHDTIAACE